MTIFALDSAGKTAGVALWRENALLYESYLATGHTHSETLLLLADGAFAVTGLTPQDVDLFAANIGPGSFTGLRIGLAALKGLAFSSDTPCAPVSTLEALAYSFAGDGVVGTALDARRGEVYCAVFSVKSGAVTRLTPDGSMSAKAFAEQLQSFSPTTKCVGDGAELVVNASEGADISLWDAAYRFGRANGICRAAQAMAARGECITAHALTPDYHRLSQAERERAAKQGIKGDCHD